MSQLEISGRSRASLIATEAAPRRIAGVLVAPDAAQTSTVAGREQELAVTLEARLTRQISRIRKEMSATETFGETGPGKVLDILA